MNQTVEQAFEAEQQCYADNLSRIRQLDPDEQDAAMASEKRRHMWAVCGIWHGRPSGQNREANLKASGG